MFYRQCRSPIHRYGNVAILVGVCMLPLCGIAALVIDGALLEDDRRRAVIAADTAALSAVADLYTHWIANAGVDSGGTAKQSAVTTAQANTNNPRTPNSWSLTSADPSAGTNTVTVHLYPDNFQGGPNVGTQIPKGQVEVIVNYYEDRAFSSIWSSDKLHVTARTVASGKYTAGAAKSTPGAAIVVLDNKDNNTLSITHTGNVIVANGGQVDVNSSSANGGLHFSSTGDLQASTINLSDSVYTKSSTGGIIGPDGTSATATVNYNVPAIPDPLGKLPEPGQTGAPAVPGAPSILPSVGYTANQGFSYNGSQNVDLYPGYYEGIKLSGSGSITLHANADGSPGLYYIGSQGLSITNSGGMTGSNVTLYTDGTGAITLSGSGNLNLTAPDPASYPNFIYSGIALFQERTSSKNVTVSSSGSMNIQGALYAAKAKVSITNSGNYTQTIGSQWIAWQLSVTATGNVNVAYGSGGNNNNAPPPTRAIGIIE